MSFAAVGVGGGLAIAGGIGAVGSIAGAAMSSGAAKDAAQTQAEASDRATQMQWNMYQQQRDDQAPWRQAGSQALTQMQDPYFQQDYQANMLQDDPGYQFRMQQGMDALQSSAAARGSLGSGNTLKAITQYGQDYASNEYQNAYNRFTNNQTNRYNRLASLAGAGQTANQSLSNAGMNYANQAGQNMMGAANAAGAAGMAGANAWGGALNGMGSNLMGMAQMSQMNNWMNKLGPKT